MNSHDQARRRWEMISSVGLFLVGILGILFETLHATEISPFGHIDNSNIVVVLISLLCVGLGSERLLTWRKIDSSLDEAASQRGAIQAELGAVSVVLTQLGLATRDGIDKVLAKEGYLVSAIDRLNKAEVLIGTRAIEEAATKLVTECNDNVRIKATGQFRSAGGLSEDYFRHVADRVKRAADAKGEMEYHVVLPPTNRGGDEAKAARAAIFEKVSVRDRLVMRRAKHSFPFEVLIGGSSMIVALVGGTHRLAYEVAIRVNDPAFIEKASDWYVEVVVADTVQET